jgi:hypothetical protein
VDSAAVVLTIFVSLWFILITLKSLFSSKVLFWLFRLIFLACLQLRQLWRPNGFGN